MITNQTCCKQESTDIFLHPHEMMYCFSRNFSRNASMVSHSKCRNIYLHSLKEFTKCIQSGNVWLDNRFYHFHYTSDKLTTHPNPFTQQPNWFKVFISQPPPLRLYHITIWMLFPYDAYSCIQELVISLFIYQLLLF